LKKRTLVGRDGEEVVMGGKEVVVRRLLERETREEG
jgi:hypothetical protein